MLPEALRVNKVFEPVIGEAMAAMAAMKFCNSKAMQDIILEGDSLQVVQAVKEKSLSWRKYGHIIDDIWLLLCTNRRWRIQDVKRTSNRAAHWLAQEGLRNVAEQQWLDHLLQCISPIALSELKAGIAY